MHRFEIVQVQLTGDVADLFPQRNPAVLAIGCGGDNEPVGNRQTHLISNLTEIGGLAADLSFASGVDHGEPGGKAGRLQLLKVRGVLLEFQLLSIDGGFQGGMPGSGERL